MSGYARYAEVLEVGTRPDQIGQLRARWPDVGEYPDWIDCAPVAALVMPAVGEFVEIRERDDQPGRFEWHGIRQQDRLPPEARTAHPDVATLQPPSRRCYLVLDGRSGADGAIRLLTVAGGEVTIRNDGARIDVKSPASGGVVRIEGAAKVIAEAPIVEIGEGALQALIRGNAFKTYFDLHPHTAWYGATGSPVTPMDVPPGTHLSTVGKVK